MAYMTIFERPDMETFNVRFMDWLGQKKNLPAPSGWAYAIEKRAKTTSQEPVDLFRTYVDEFLTTWDSVSDGLTAYGQDDSFGR